VAFERSAASFERQLSRVRVYERLPLAPSRKECP
jgi:hypothetical protein